MVFNPVFLPNGVVSYMDSREFLRTFRREVGTYRRPAVHSPIPVSVRVRHLKDAAVVHLHGTVLPLSSDPHSEFRCETARGPARIEVTSAGERILRFCSMQRFSRHCTESLSRFRGQQSVAAGRSSESPIRIRINRVRSKPDAVIL